MAESTGKQEFKVQGDSLLKALRSRRAIFKDSKGSELINVTLLLALILVVLMPQLVLIFALIVLARGGTFLLERVDQEAACC